jgi:hypothetical protein
VVTEKGNRRAPEVGQNTEGHDEHKGETGTNAFHISLFNYKNVLMTANYYLISTL